MYQRTLRGPASFVRKSEKPLLARVVLEALPALVVEDRAAVERRGDCIFVGNELIEIGFRLVLAVGLDLAAVFGSETWARLSER